MSLLGMESWHVGLAAQADLNKIGYRRWMESFQDPEKVKEARTEEMKKGAELWEMARKTSSKGS